MLRDKLTAADAAKAASATTAETTLRNAAVE